MILGGLAAFGPLSIDMYLPAFPDLARTLGASESMVQLTLTAFMVGLAAGQVVAGPLSDSFGRRRPLLVGLVLYTASSLVCAVAPSIEALAALRLAQGVSAGAGIVIARAAVRDLYSGTEMAQFFSMLMLVNGLGPMLAPVIGGQVLRVSAWPGVFVVLAGFGVLLLVASALGLPETLPRDRRRPARVGGIARTYARIATDRTFMAYALSAGFSMGAMFAYISGSSFVLQGIHGMSPQGFSLVFAVNALGIMALSQGNRVLLRRFSPRRLLSSGLWASAVGGLVVLASALLDLGLPVLLPGLFVVVASVGVVSPNCAALALADHGRRAGAAAALLGLLQFLFGGLAAPLVGLGGNGTALPMAVVIAVLSVAGVVTFAATRPTRRRPGRYVAFREAETMEIEVPLGGLGPGLAKPAPERAQDGGGEDGEGGLGPAPGFRGRFRGESVREVERPARGVRDEHP